MGHSPCLCFVVVKIGGSLLNSFLLLWSHAESLVAVPCCLYTVSYANDGSPDLLRCTSIPFTLYVLTSHTYQLSMHIMVHKCRTILSHRRFFHYYAVGRFTRTYDVILLAHPLLYANRCVAHFQQSAQLWVILVLIRINHRSRLRLAWEITLCCCHNLYFCRYGALVTKFLLGNIWKGNLAALKSQL